MKTLVTWRSADEAKRSLRISIAINVGCFIAGSAVTFGALAYASLHDRIVPVQVSSAVQRGA